MRGYTRAEEPDSWPAVKYSCWHPVSHFAVAVLTGVIVYLWQPLTDND